jgi:hypothetical protein
MERSFRSVLILLAGIALLATAGSIRAIGTDTVTWPSLLGLAGIALLGWGTFSLRTELGAMVRQRRGEIALHTLGVIGVLLAVAYLSVRFTVRVDMTTTGCTRCPVKPKRCSSV